MFAGSVWPSIAREKNPSQTRFVSSGEPILIEGRLKFRQWGGQSGKAEKKHEVIVDRFEFVGGNRDSTPGETSTPQPGAPSASPTEDNDVPF